MNKAKITILGIVFGVGAAFFLNDGGSIKQCPIVPSRGSDIASVERTDNPVTSNPYKSLDPLLDGYSDYDYYETYPYYYPGYSWYYYNQPYYYYAPYPRRYNHPYRYEHRRSPYYRRHYNYHNHRPPLHVRGHAGHSAPHAGGHQGHGHSR